MSYGQKMFFFAFVFRSIPTVSKHPEASQVRVSLANNALFMDFPVHMVDCIALKSRLEFAKDYLAKDLCLQTDPPVTFSVLLTAQGSSGCALSACMLCVYKHIRPLRVGSTNTTRQRMQIAFAQSMNSERFTAATDLVLYIFLCSVYLSN